MGLAGFAYRAAQTVTDLLKKSMGLNFFNAKNRPKFKEGHIKRLPVQQRIPGTIFLHNKAGTKGL
ncbi:MAG: hypothetical protein D6677_02590 [Calditrichaeota bacterium]|nr:MAG: hypothetical protein D6677_02590 [Calditrichota bacterium]